ncbi:MAG: hypothetical protein Q8L98_02315 [Chlamydiales bacterium]|nr:hypothetical protein [Chlamydiales bacterium]
MFTEDILIEIDTTLDQLIKNAESIQDVELKELSEIEISAFQKTQESLVHHLLHLDKFFETRKMDQKIFHKKSGRYKIQEKILKFERLKKEYKKNLGESLESWHRRDLLMKRRCKKILH